MSRLATLVLVVSLPAWAQRAFPFTWDSAPLAPRAHEVQSWVTPRLGRTDVNFMQLDVRFQVAQGVSRWVDTMFGLDLDLASFDVDSRTIDAKVSSTWRASITRADAAVGFAVVTRAAVGLLSGDLELRLVLDKQFGPLLLALNATAVRSVIWSGNDEINARFEQSFGARYQVQAEFAAGLEVRAREAFQNSTYMGTALMGGPTFSYVAKQWWLSFGLLVQAGGEKTRVDRGNGEPLEVRDNERFVGRIILGVKTD